MTTRYLMVDGSYGIYVPKRFYDNVDLSDWGLNKDDYSGLSNPDNEDYWELWDDVMERARYVSSSGIEYRLEMDDGDCFITNIEIEDTE